MDVFSPKYYEEARMALNKAIKARAENENQKDVLHYIALSQAYLEKAFIVTNVGNQMMKPVVDARFNAINAGAARYSLKEFVAADKDLEKITRQIEDNNTSGVEANRNKFEINYREIELNSLKKDKLGMADFNLKEAIKEGAEKLTPETLAWAQNQISTDEAIITSDTHDTNAINKASADASAASVRLLMMVRNAKGSTAKSPEDFAMQIEQSHNSAVQAEKDLSQAENKIENYKDKLATTSHRTDVLESEAMLDNKFEAARKQFSKNEADVYIQGNKLTLRLKGLSFDQNNANLTSKDFALLGKVQKVLGEIGTGKVVVEGHTDSRGSKELNDKLSMKRAESVQSYLLANGAVNIDQIVAEGMGDSNPISTNKTAEGRAMNRRVDVTITAENVIQ
jgi:outer membrane protein OmpA-like peptidoglycan-associated protein